ncbi:Zn finger [Halorubrum tailed virus 27]|uniref:Zn finger n=1 Tax=Halorubrum tailed virus 27 TaxID=2878008 RepID=A0AAE8Y016_9CAUD|nr:Zn finger [Halorubrum tailed virus 27]UBF22744.1 Zn finger [Halorubrum tailed virus 27]
MDEIRAALLSEFEPFETDTRCLACGERLKVEPNENHGFDVLCGGCQPRVGVRGTDRAWIEAEFCEPFEETGVPAPVSRAGEIYHARD